MGRWQRHGTTQYFYNARSTAFFSRIAITRIQRSVAMEYIKTGKMKPWYYRKEQILGAPAAVSMDYQPRPVRLLGTVMDTFSQQTSLRGGIKVYSRSEGTNVCLWVPAANPKVKYELQSSTGSFAQFLDERDKWDEAWITGRARLK